MTKLSLYLRDVTKSQIINDPDDLKCGRKFLILINPFSGSGKAPKIFKNQICPMLDKSGCDYDVITTCRRNGAFDYVLDCPNLYDWDGIVVVSGDGLLFEVFNALMSRDDWEKAIKIPVGIIPGGSGNGLAATIEWSSG